MQGEPRLRYIPPIRSPVVITYTLWPLLTTRAMAQGSADCDNAPKAELLVFFKKQLRKGLSKVWQPGSSPSRCCFRRPLCFSLSVSLRATRCGQNLLAAAAAPDVCVCVCVCVCVHHSCTCPGPLCAVLAVLRETNMPSTRPSMERRRCTTSRLSSATGEIRKT